MADVYIRGLSEPSKTSLAILAAKLGVSLNVLCCWILEEAAMPYDDLREALHQRAEEVQTARARQYDVYPTPTHPTQPLKRQRKPPIERNKYGQIVLHAPEDES